MTKLATAECQVSDKCVALHVTERYSNKLPGLVPTVMTNQQGSNLYNADQSGALEI